MRPDARNTLRGLYPVTPEDYLLPRLSAHVAMTLKGGARILQYRSKHAPAPLRRSQAAEMLRICRGEGARLIVNDDLALGNFQLRECFIDHLADTCAELPNHFTVDDRKHTP